MEITDVTLRDGGFSVNFDWPLEFAKHYYKTLCKIQSISYIELGYWKQTKITNNRFYNLNIEEVNKITDNKKLGNVSVMLDYHNCSKNINDYPTSLNSEVGMIRLCSRQEHIPVAIEFGKKLKYHTGLQISFNLIKVSNYTEDEFIDTCSLVSDYPFDVICFADTFGCVDFSKYNTKYKRGVDIIKSKGKKAGMHMHNHNGKSISNYSLLEDIGFDMVDTSIRGMGKGAGNLKLEYILENNDLTEVVELIRSYESLLTLPYNPYCLITSKHSLSDNYAIQAKKYQLSIPEFDYFCSKLSGIDKNNYKDILLKDSLIRGKK